MSDRNLGWLPGDKDDRLFRITLVGRIGGAYQTWRNATWPLCLDHLATNAVRFRDTHGHLVVIAPGNHALVIEEEPQQP